MPITDKQREKRQRYLGSSDAAAVCGLDIFRNPADVYYDKTGQIEPTGQPVKSAAIDVGNWMERGVLAWFASEMGVKLVRNQNRVHENGIMAANIDAMVKGDPTQLVEAKTHGILSKFIGEDWGEVGTGEVPERVQLQCQHQMAVVPTAQVVHVPVLLGGAGLQRYRVERDQKLIDDLTDIEVTFWQKYVLARVPPPEVVASEGTFKRLKREPNKVVSIADELVVNWLMAKEVLKEAEANKKKHENLLLGSLGDAEAGESSYGKLTYFMSKPRAAYTVPEHPGYRQLRLVKQLKEIK